MKQRYFFVGIGTLFLFLLITFFVLSSAPSNDSTLRPFVINQGESKVDVAARLAKNKFIKSPPVFLVWSLFTGQKNNIKAGKFNLSASWDSKTVLKELVSGGSSDYWLKIIPGQRLEETKIEAPDSAEGYLFPDSYLIPDYFTPDEILSLIKKNFDAKYASVSSNSQLSQAEAVTLASLLEREAKTRSDKQKVAAVLLNRLKIGMPIQVDATIQYARDTLRPPTKYWLPLKKTDLQISSTYNTYQNRGLPPSPICNPGLDSLFAALNPATSDSLYYISGRDGLMYFATTLDGHNANIAKYLK